MPQSLDNVLIHLIFSTKDHKPYLRETVRSELFPYMATVVRNGYCGCDGVGGVADHVHLAIRLSRTRTIANLVQDVKTTSSKWLKSRYPFLRRFAWQRGYGVFSVGPSDIDALTQYIESQDNHHRKWTFKDEFRMFLKKYGVAYDERYVWE